jgi:hypothetical protein
MSDVSVSDAPPKPRPRTSPVTWAFAVAFVVAAAAGGYGWYVTLGPGRTVDASSIEKGMTRLDVAKVLGDPDDYITSGDETAMRYGRTHVWTKGMPGRVTEVTVGPR